MLRLTHRYSLSSLYSLVSPQGNAVSLGGADSSVGLAQVTTEWPDSWSRSRSGTYRAEMDVSLATLSGSGTWTVFIMNAWSLSERVEYDVSIGFRFSGRPDSKTGGSCTPTMSPTPRDTSAPTASMAPTPSPTFILKNNVQYVIPIEKVALAVRDDGKALHQDSVTIHSFAFMGTLSAIELKLDPYNDGYQTRGTDAWLLAVAVTDPYGLVAQVGGSGWRKQPDAFYKRNWPDPWLGRFSGGLSWSGSRDVHAAGLGNVTAKEKHSSGGKTSSSGDLSDLSKPHYDDYYYQVEEVPSAKPTSLKSLTSAAMMRPLGLWSVDLAMGYPWTVRTPVNFSGSVILHFTGTEQTGVILAFPFKPSDSPRNSSDSDIPTAPHPTASPLQFNGDDGSTKSPVNGDKGGNNDGSPGTSSPSGPGTVTNDDTPSSPNHGGYKNKPNSGAGNSTHHTKKTGEDDNTMDGRRTDLRIFRGIRIAFWFVLVSVIVSLIIYILFRFCSCPTTNRGSEESVGLFSVMFKDNIRRTKGDEVLGRVAQSYPQEETNESNARLLSDRRYGSTDV